MNYTRIRNVVIIQLSENDLNNTALKETFRNVLFAVKRFEITLLDMENIKYLDSFAMSTLLILVNKSREYGNQLRFCNLKEHIREVIKFHSFDSQISTLSHEQYEKIREFTVAF